MKKVYFITGNKFKFEEAKHILPTLEQLNLDLIEIQEVDAKKIISNKLDEALKQGNGPFVVDDVSFEINCLNGFPGPLIKWLLKKMSLNEIVALVNKYKDKSAKAKILIGYAEIKNGKVIKKYFSGVWLGKVVSPKGSLDFGWNAMFLPNGSNRTAGEMSSKEHSKISMRAMAFNKLKKYLEKND